MAKGNRVIKSPNPDQEPLWAPGPFSYKTGTELRRGPIPMVFQITSPFDPMVALLPHSLVLHVNPSSFAETHTKKIERIQTRGGFVEQHWQDELSEISADASTGAFVNLYTGVTSVLRQRTIAWDRFRDLYDIFHNNGSVYDPYGNIVLQGNVMILFDRGTYIGYFRTFSYEETEDSPFTFKLSWSFKVQQILVQIPDKVRLPDIIREFPKDIPTNSGEPKDQFGLPLVFKPLSPAAQAEQEARIAAAGEAFVKQRQLEAKAAPGDEFFDSRLAETESRRAPDPLSDHDVSVTILKPDPVGAAKRKAAKQLCPSPFPTFRATPHPSLLRLLVGTSRLRGWRSCTLRLSMTN